MKAGAIQGLLIDGDFKPKGCSGPQLARYIQTTMVRLNHFLGNSQSQT